MYRSTPYDQQFARYHDLSVTGLRPELSSLISHFFHKADYVGVHVKITSLQQKVCKISSFKFISAMNLTFDLESQGHILFPMVKFADMHIKINSIDQQFVR